MFPNKKNYLSSRILRKEFFIRSSSKNIIIYIWLKIFFYIYKININFFIKFFNFATDILSPKLSKDKNKIERILKWAQWQRWEDIGEFFIEMR